MAGLTDEERIRLSELWEYLREDGPPLTERDFELIDWALRCLRRSGDPRPAKTALEIRRVCLIAAKMMLKEEGLTKKEVMERLLGDGSNGIRYAFKNRVINYDTLHGYLHQHPDDRPEKYLREGIFLPKDRIAMEMEEWEFWAEQSITDGVPEL